MTDENATPVLPGERLREQRERRGLTIAQASAELHVDQRMLAALEADDYPALGAPIFVKGHLRSYARLLGLDPAELIAQYEAAQKPAEPELVAHRPDGPRMDSHRSHAWVGWFGWVFLLLLGVLLAGWWWYQQEGGGDFVISNVPERVNVPATRQPQPTVRDETIAAPSVEQGDDVAPPSVLENEGAGTESAGDSSAAMQQDATVATAPATRTVQPPPAAASRSASPASGRGLVLEFSEESWVEIYDAEGRPILYDLLAAGTRREINASGQLRVFLGNAAGVDVTVAGEAFDISRYHRSDDTARFTVNVSPAERP